MLSFVVLTVSAIHTILATEISLQPEFNQTDPFLTLKSYHSFTVNKNEMRNGSQVSIPRAFDKLVFECNSTLPTKWKFYAEQIKDPSVKKIEINKWRSPQNSNKTTYRFHSTFKVVYSNPSTLLKLWCENVCPKNSSPSECKNARMTHTTNPEHPEIFVLQFTKGNKEQRKKEKNKIRKVDDRLGGNVDCKYTLHVDLNTGNYACTEANNTLKEVPTVFVPCNNPDECATVVGKNEEKCDFNVTFQRNCSSSFCTQLRDTSKLFVLACGENNNNSVARIFFKPLQYNNGTSQGLYEYERDMKPTAKMGVVAVKMNTSIVESCGCKYVAERELLFTGYTREFTCSALKSFFSHGFRWILRYENNSQKDLGTGRENTNDTARTYTSTKSIYINFASIKEVICEAPIWNSLEGLNATMNVTVEESVGPGVVENDFYNATEFLRRRDITMMPSDTNQTLTCKRIGRPPAEIKWTFDGVKPGESGTSTRVSKHYNQHDTNNKSEVTLLPNHPFTEVVCIVANAAGKAEVHFKFEKETAHPDYYIVVGVCSSAFFLLVIVVIAAVWKIRKQKKHLHLTEKEIEEFHNGNPKASDAFLIPYNMDLEVPPDKITTSDQVLGSGAYGLVVKGTYGSNIVAIKTMKATADVEYLKALLSELKIMSFVGRHPNVVNLLGACTQNIRNREIHIILEYCDLGDMVTLLRKHRGIFCNFFEIQFGDVETYSRVEYENKTVKRLNTMDLIRWSAEIALGMDFLSSKNVIHGDLAGRNILITEDYIAKVSDFGLAKQLFEYSTYVQKVNIPLPLRWMAYESLKDLKFSVQSDIWSYGIVMWEIFSLGETPYPGMEWGFDSWKEILKGKRNDMPQYASDCLYALMWDCWNLDPKSRPSFQFLWETLLEYSENFRALDECC